MSDRLAISAAFSVLAMAIYVLFFAQVPRASLGPVQSATSAQGLRADMPDDAGTPLLDRVLAPLR